MGERKGTKGLELWCRRMTEGYPGVNVVNMTTSWRDGLAFCAIIHHFRPDLIEFSKLNKDDIYYNNELAFRTAEHHLGIPALLEPEDMVEFPVPDRLSILTYLSQFYQTFVVGQGKSAARIAAKRPASSPEHNLVSPASSSPPTKVAFPSAGKVRREPCAKCSLPVFIAERLNVGKLLYHRTCFRCARCDSQLTLANYYETENNEFCCETCPDEEKSIFNQPDSSVLTRSLSDEEKSASLKKREETDDYSAKFETALEYPDDDSLKRSSTLNTSQYSKARSFFIGSQVESSNSDSGNEDEPPPDLPKTKPPARENMTFDDSFSDSGFPKDKLKTNVNTQSSVSLGSTSSKLEKSHDIVTKDTISAEGKTISLVKARMRLFETKSDAPNETNSVNNKVPSRNSISANIEVGKNKKEDSSLHSFKDNTLNKDTSKGIQNSVTNILDMHENKTKPTRKSDGTILNETSSVEVNVPQKADDSIVTISDDTEKSVITISDTTENSSIDKTSKTIEDTSSIIISSDLSLQSEETTEEKNKKNEEVKNQQFEETPSVIATLPLQHDESTLENIHVPSEEKLDVKETEILDEKSPDSATVVPVIKSLESAVVVPPTESPESAAVVPATESPKSAAVVPATESSKSAAVVPATESPKSAAVIPATESPESAAVVPGTEFPESAAVVPATESPESAAVVPATASPESSAAVPNTESPKSLAVEPSAVPTPSSVVSPENRDEYPDDLNPFGDDDDTEPEEVKKSVIANVSLNPFEDEEEDTSIRQSPRPAARRKIKPSAEDKEISRLYIERVSTNPFEEDDAEEEVPQPVKRKVIPPPKISLNPFWSDDEENDQDSKPVPKPRLSKSTVSAPEPKPRESGLSITSSTTFGSSSSVTSSQSGYTNKKKKPAPKPPSMLSGTESGPSSLTSSPSHSVTHSPRSTPKIRKTKKAPPPPTSTPIDGTSAHLDIDIAAVGDDFEREKFAKDEQNRNRQSQNLSLQSPSSSENSSSLSAPNKSTYGKWKRRKGQAPARPIPQRRIIKSLPMFEVRRELELIEIQQQGLEKQGVRLEQIIREKCEGPGVSPDDSLAPEIEEMVLQLFELVNEKNELFRRQAELMYLRRQQKLEEEHADIEYQIRCLMVQPEANKTDSDKAREEELINRLVEIVERRNEIIECLEMDRVREAEEDDSINNQLNLYTLKKEEDKSSENKQAKKEKKKHKKEKKSKLKGHKVDADKDIDESESSTSSVKDKKKKKFNIF